MLLFASPALADEWSNTSKWLFAATAAAYLADGASTIGFLHQTDAVETNPILGKHPTDAQVIAYISGCILLSWAIADLLPDSYRPFFLIPVMLVEIKASRHNFIILFRR